MILQIVHWAIPIRAAAKRAVDMYRNPERLFRAGAELQNEVHAAVFRLEFRQRGIRATDQVAGSVGEAAANSANVVRAWRESRCSVESD